MLVSSSLLLCIWNSWREISPSCFASPEFAGNIYGIGNTFGTLGGALGCVLSDSVTNAIGWTYSYALCSGLMVLASFVWLFGIETVSHLIKYENI